MSCYKSYRILKSIGISEDTITIFIAEEIDWIALQHMEPQHFIEIGCDPFLYWEIKVALLSPLVPIGG